MELELGLKLAKVADEFTTADLQIAKDRSGPVFLSTETDTVFIVTAHLRGYRKGNIKIEINEDGTRIIISGEKAVQETVMVGWRFHWKETEIRAFRKGFKIPDGVILDKIRAKFDEEESELTISMPKKVKGIRGVIVEELKEHELARGGSETLQIDDHDLPREEISNLGDRYTEAYEPGDGKSPEEPEIVSGEEPQESEKKGIHDQEEHAKEEEQEGKDERLQKVEEPSAEKIEATQGPEEPSAESSGKAPVDETTDGLQKEEIRQEVRGNTEAEQAPDKGHGKENDVKADEQEEQESALVKAPEVADQEDGKEEKERFKICTPIVAGSALLLSIVVIVINFIRTKSQTGRRKD